MITDYEYDFPFFPKYETDFLYEKLRVSWFESKFSQSNFNYENATNGSNACTLICVIIAAHCNKNRDKLNIEPTKDISPKVIHIFGRSMLEGNRIHSLLKSKGKLKNVNLTVPEAMSYAKKISQGLIEWKCVLYLEPLSTSLFQNLKKNWLSWIDDHYHEDLYVILITDSRSVIFYFHQESDNRFWVSSLQKRLSTRNCSSEIAEILVRNR